MPGFKIESKAYELLHNIWLGTARDLFASGLKTLVMQGCYSYTGLADFDSILSYVDSNLVFLFGEMPPSGLEPATQTFGLSHRAHLRLGLPAKPQINAHSLNGDDDYAELSSRFKGSSVKVLIWWLAGESYEQASKMPNEPR